ncbi:MAG: tRNA 2-thiouridine(34) synthase MnmA [Sphaerochaeta sp.]
MQKVLVGMSGGIDSSVAAYILKEQGYAVSGVTMTLWKEGRSFIHDSCFSMNKKKDVEEAAAVCEKLGIKHTVLDIAELYESVVLKNFRDEYLNGRTPNPCIWCNQKIKFGAMIDYAREAGLDFDYFATGHYARIEKENGRFCLKRGLDLLKDQSYFLYRLSQKQLSETLFPLGSMKKSDVRGLDLKLGFHQEGQAESQDFYGGSYFDLLDVKPKAGDIVDCGGKVLGRHSGIWNYTIGQRRGLGVSASRPLYVIALDVEKNRVVVGYEENIVNIVVRAGSLCWGAVESLEGTIHASAKIRSTGMPVRCSVRTEGEDCLYAVFDVPVKAATCGQSLVIYENDKVLCGGIIESVD